MADETTKDAPEKVVEVLLPPEAAAADAETLEEKKPEEPVSKVKEWALAVAIMIFFSLIFWGFTAFLRPG